MQEAVLFVGLINFAARQILPLKEATYLHRTSNNAVRHVWLKARLLHRLVTIAVRQLLPSNSEGNLPLKEVAYSTREMNPDSHRLNKAAVELRISAYPAESRIFAPL